MTSPSTLRVGLDTPILTAGSCFSETIGDRLKQYKFDVLVNPFGTIFNPIALQRVMIYAIQGGLPEESGYVSQQGVWNHYEFHSSFSGLTKEETRLKIESAIRQVRDFLEKARWLILTYGTAWVYERNGTTEVVANCHKVAASQFSRRLLTAEEVGDSFDQLVGLLKQKHPAIQVIVTVSPVRHIKDTLEGNSISKALLRVAAHSITQKHSFIHYFPSYELMMDDLRDYRFYAQDMLHPSEDAIDYIWEKFSNTYFSSETTDFIVKWQSLLTALRHRPFQSQSAVHQKFLHETINRLTELSGHVNVEKEVDALRSQLR